MVRHENNIKIESIRCGINRKVVKVAKWEIRIKHRSVGTKRGGVKRIAETNQMLFYQVIHQPRLPKGLPG
jgi:hypothetical protein